MDIDKEIELREIELLTECQDDLTDDVQHRLDLASAARFDRLGMDVAANGPAYV